MKKMAKVAAMLAALALLFGAIGCSGGGSDEPSYEEPPITGDDVDPSRPPSSGGDVDPSQPPSPGNGDGDITPPKMENQIVLTTITIFGK